MGRSDSTKTPNVVYSAPKKLMAEYVFDQSWQKERARLASYEIESLRLGC